MGVECELWISSFIFTSVRRSFPMANLWLHSFTTCSFLHFSLRLTVYPPPHEVLPSHDQPNALGSLISQSSGPWETCSQISSHLKQRSALWILVWSVRGSAGSAVHHGKWMLLPAACWGEFHNRAFDLNKCFSRSLSSSQRATFILLRFWDMR